MNTEEIEMVPFDDLDEEIEDFDLSSAILETETDKSAEGTSLLSSSSKTNRTSRKNRRSSMFTGTDASMITSSEGKSHHKSHGKSSGTSHRHARRKSFKSDKSFRSEKTLSERHSHMDLMEDLGEDVELDEINEEEDVLHEFVDEKNMPLAAQLSKVLDMLGPPPGID